jgi:hypothetical protein
MCRDCRDDLHFDGVKLALIVVLIDVVRRCHVEDRWLIWNGQ